MRGEDAESGAGGDSSAEDVRSLVSSQRQQRRTKQMRAQLGGYAAARDADERRRAEEREERRYRVSVLPARQSLAVLPPNC